MMRISTMLVTGATFGALVFSTLPASAAVLSIAQVTNGCPDLDQARDCPVLADEFLSSRPMSPASDGEIVSLVLAIAELSQVPRVSMQVCLNAADGLRVLAGGVSNSDQQTQIEDIADSLCDGTSTAALRRDLGDANSLASAGTTGGGGNTGPGGGGTGGGIVPVPVDTGGDGTDSDDDGNNGHGNDDDHDDESNPGGGNGPNADTSEVSTGLGSNDAAAGRGNGKGESNANVNATANTHGKNGN